MNFFPQLLMNVYLFGVNRYKNKKIAKDIPTEQNQGYGHIVNAL